MEDALPIQPAPVVHLQEVWVFWGSEFSFPWDSYRLFLSLWKWQCSLFFDSRIEGSLPIINDRNVDRILLCECTCHPKLSKYNEPVFIFSICLFMISVLFSIQWKVFLYHISAFSTIKNYMTRENLVLRGYLRYSSGFVHGTLKLSIKWFVLWSPLTESIGSPLTKSCWKEFPSS